eukprot:TRINITY_DN17633_c0_g1_i1.p1 TRINITY_DN17633_c0_g1~~TRINITY_DN17633_c0_g1_i1.p1  ORF type:complete len:125 (+),score=31.84 TRINITY_DN17633_c0_g1_i1:43-375(+)
MARCMLMILLATSVSSQLLQRPSDNHPGGDSQDVDAMHEQDTVLSRHRRGYGLTSEGFATVGGLLLGVLTYISIPQTRRRQGRLFTTTTSRQGGRCVYRMGAKCVYKVWN